MAKSLVIVESPAKAKTINKYLGSDYTVKASMGHVMDLPKKNLGVNIEKDFSPSYTVIPAKKEVIQAFHKQEYWTISANVKGNNPPPFDARLIKFQAKELEIPDQAAADRHVTALNASSFIVQSLTHKEKRRYPVPPFITSKLQQEGV